MKMLDVVKPAIERAAIASDPRKASGSARTDSIMELARMVEGLAMMVDSMAADREAKPKPLDLEAVAMKVDAEWAHVRIGVAAISGDKLKLTKLPVWSDKTEFGRNNWRWIARRVLEVAGVPVTNDKLAEAEAMFDAKEKAA